MKNLLFTLLTLTAPLYSQECSHLWTNDLAINPATPKSFSGDTYAAYALLGFQQQPHLKLVFEGEFPKARFSSFESYVTEKKRAQDALFDYEIEPEMGSLNPSHIGVALSTPHRKFKVQLVHGEGKSTDTNTLFMSSKEKVIAVYYRIYTPNSEEVSASAIPKIYAFDDRTNTPIACPKPANVVFAPNLPQALSYWVPAKKSFDFKDKTTPNGTNSAVLLYLVGYNKVKLGQVTVVSYKAPEIFNTQSGQGVFQEPKQTRYWSICTQNFVKSKTLNCLPDYKAVKDNEGRVTIVLGNSDAVRSEALKRGYNYLEDKREKDQPVLQLVYRNVLPNTQFQKENMYKGDFRPTGTTCSEHEFLENECE